MCLFETVVYHLKNCRLWKRLLSHLVIQNQILTIFGGLGYLQRPWPSLMIQNTKWIFLALNIGDKKTLSRMGYHNCLSVLSTRTRHEGGGRVKKIGRIFWNSVKTGGIGLVRIPKPPILLFTVSKFQKKIKVSKKYVKKLDQILRLLVKKFL
jgi:hypothetical protein